MALHNGDKMAMALIIATLKIFFRLDQFFGFSGSLGEIQFTTILPSSSMDPFGGPEGADETLSASSLAVEGVGVGEPLNDATLSKGTSSSSNASGLDCLPFSKSLFLESVMIVLGKRPDGGASDSRMRGHLLFILQGEKLWVIGTFQH